MQLRRLASQRRDRILLTRAAAMAAAGDHVRAVAEGDAMWGRVAEPDSTLSDEAGQVFAVAVAAARGDSTLSTGERDRLAEQYAQRAVAALRKANPSGLDAAQLKRCPDFEAIRQRDDFKKLLADLDEAAKQKHE